MIALIKLARTKRLQEVEEAFAKQASYTQALQGLSHAQAKQVCVRVCGGVVHVDKHTHTHTHTHNILHTIYMHI